MQQPDRETSRIGPRCLKDPASVEYAWQTLAYLKTCFQMKQLSVEDWEKVLDEADQHEIYLRIPPEQPYGSLDAMLKAEIGVPIEESRKSVKDRAEDARNKELAGKGLPRMEIGKGKAGPGKGNKTASDRSRFAHGENSDYLSARIARDHPEILDRMEAGEFKSVRQAAIAAGIVKVPTTLDLLRKTWAKATAEEREAFRQEIAD